jgi:predicted DNA-binding transcriptional regulator YafY
MWNTIIADAINNKNLIEVTYDRDIRLVEPHVLGYKNSKLELLVWQLNNYGEVSSTNEWRTFEIQKITNIKITTQTFLGARATKSYSHPSWTQIIAKVN